MVSTMSLVVWAGCLLNVAAEWYQPGGTRCADNPFPSCSTDECRKPADATATKCECDIGNNGRIGSKFCLNGKYVAAWYPKTQGEQASLDAPGSYTQVIEAGFEEHNNNLAKAGLCFDRSTAESAQMTCDGIPNYQSPVTNIYATSGCKAANWSRNESDWRGPNMTVFCYRKSDVNPRSDCNTCSNEDPMCNTADECTFAGNGEGVSLCSYSSNTCACKSKIYKRGLVCIGGDTVTLYYKASSYASCKSNSGWYFKSVQKASVCESSRREDGITHTLAQTCAGVADGESPITKYFNNSNCGDAFEKIDKRYLESTRSECECMAEGEEIQSECRSCVDSTCTADQKSCTLAKGNVCSWNPSDNSCACAYNNWKSSGLCWGGRVADLYFKDVARSKCLTPTAESLTYSKVKSMSDSDVQCTKNYDMSEARKGAASMIQRDCTGVADGKKPNSRYFNDAECKTVNESLSQEVSWGEEPCECQGPLACSKGTKFEKYFCDAGGKIIKQEFTDSECKIATGVNNTAASFTDVGGANTCLAWPPKFHTPTSTTGVMWSCTVAGAFPNYSHWPTSSECSGTPPNQGPIEGCQCTGELNFNEVAKDSNMIITGDLTLTVSDVSAAVSDETFKTVVKMSIAEAAGVPEVYVTGLVLTAARRLSQSEKAERRLASGGLKASYTIVAPKHMETSITNAVKATTPTAMQSRISTKMTSAGMTYTVTAAVVEVPTVIEATPNNFPDPTTGLVPTPTRGVASGAIQPASVGIQSALIVAIGGFAASLVSAM